MTATTTTTVLVPIQPAFIAAERLALAGFLAAADLAEAAPSRLPGKQPGHGCRARDGVAVSLMVPVAEGRFAAS